MKKKKYGIAFAAALVAFSLVGVIAYSTNSVASAGSEAPKDVGKQESAYPTNENNQTYGTLVDAESIGELPDLILADTTDGQTGYIYRTDYIETSRAAENPEEAEAIMNGYQQGAVKAFQECVIRNTGEGVDDKEFDALLTKIYTTSGFGRNWDNLTKDQQEAMINLLPEKYRSSELAQQAYGEAIGANDVRVPVYKLDGKTVIGELIAQ
jgi:hypothetical protein